MAAAAALTISTAAGSWPAHHAAAAGAPAGTGRHSQWHRLLLLPAARWTRAPLRRCRRRRQLPPPTSACARDSGGARSCWAGAARVTRGRCWAVVFERGGRGHFRTCCASPPWLPLLPLERPSGAGLRCAACQQLPVLLTWACRGDRSEAAQGKTDAGDGSKGKPRRFSAAARWLRCRRMSRPPATSCAMPWRAAHQPITRTPVHATDQVEVYMPRTEVSRQGSGAGRKSGGRPHSAPAYIAHG